MATKLKRLLKSFTLIELIIVIAIIAVLGASAFLLLSQWMSKSRDSRKLADLSSIDNAINISVAKNDKLPNPDDVSKIMFSGTRIWDVGYFGDQAVEELGGTLTKSPIDPTTKERYRYAQWNNQKYQLGTIIENQQFSKYLNRTYAQSYFTRLQGNYTQSIIITKIDNVDTLLPVPSLIVDEFDGEEKILDEEHFWTNKGTYSLGTEQKTTMKVQSLYSGDLSKLSDTTSDEFNNFINNFEKVYSGTNFVNILNNQSEDEIKVAIAQELSKVSSQPVSVNFLGCEGFNHGAKVDFYKQETVGYGESCDSIKSQFECNNGNWIGENKDEYTKTSCNPQLPAQCDGNDHGTVKDFFSTDSVTYGQTCTPNLKSFTCDNGVWKDGTNTADTSTYQYSSCVVGNPVDCNATNIVKKSVSNLDITFDIPSTLHGLSFERSKTIIENNGSYEYTLVGDCSNGTYQEVILSDPVNKGCNTGYELEGNSCVPKNCDASTQIVNTRSYNVGAINHGGTSTITTSPIGITNGTITYTQSFQCNLGTISTSGSETVNTPICETGYSLTGNNCILNKYTVNGSVGVNGAGATISICGSNITADSSGNFVLNLVSYGTVCNNLVATKANYTCTVTTNGPTSLESNVNNISGSCVSNKVWSGDTSAGFTFKDGGVTMYPTSCNNLLTSTVAFKSGTTLPWNGTKFVDGYYYIKPNAAAAFKVYCDMTTNSGGRTRYLNIKGNYTFENAKSCWLGTIINNTTLECFNPNRFSLLGTQLMISTPRHATVKTKYLTLTNTSNSVSAQTPGSTYYCLGHNNYMTIMREGGYPSSDGSNASRIRLGVNYGAHGGRQVGGRASTNFMNYSNGGTYGPTQGDREASARLSSVFIR